MKTYKIEFPDTDHPSLELPEGSRIGDELTEENSPLFYGCFTGICATCLVEVEHMDDSRLAPPNELEEETIEFYAPEDNKNCRLVCQLELTANIRLRKVDAV